MDKIIGLCWDFREYVNSLTIPRDDYNGIMAYIQDIQNAAEHRMDEPIPKKIAIDALEAIRHSLWGIDIPHPGNCPEYREHHKQIQDMMEIVDMWIERIKMNSDGGTK